MAEIQPIDLKPLLKRRFAEITTTRSRVICNEKFKTIQLVHEFILYCIIGFYFTMNTVNFTNKKGVIIFFKLYVANSFRFVSWSIPFENQMSSL